MLEGNSTMARKSDNSFIQIPVVMDQSNGLDAYLSQKLESCTMKSQ